MKSVATGYADPLAGAGEALDLLHGFFFVLVGVAVGPKAVTAALEKARHRHRRKSLQVGARERSRSLHHSVDEKRVAVRIDFGDARVVALEM